MIVYLIVLAIIQFALAAFFITILLVEENDFGIDSSQKKTLRYLLVALVTSPFGGIVMPLAIIIGIFHGLFKAFKLAFGKED